MDGPHTHPHTLGNARGIFPPRPSLRARFVRAPSSSSSSVLPFRLWVWRDTGKRWEWGRGWRADWWSRGRWNDERTSDNTHRHIHTSHTHTHTHTYIHTYIHTYTHTHTHTHTPTQNLPSPHYLRRVGKQLTLLRVVRKRGPKIGQRLQAQGC